MEGPYEPLPQLLQIGQPLLQLLQLKSDSVHVGHGGAGGRGRGRVRGSRAKKKITH